MSKKQLTDEVCNCLYKNYINDFDYKNNQLSFCIDKDYITVKFFYINIFFFQFTHITYVINGNTHKHEYYFSKRSESPFRSSTLSEIIYDLSWNAFFKMKTP